MVQESLARRFKPAGFEQPEGSRREYTKPRSELKEAFDKWLKNPVWFNGEQLYRAARDSVWSIGEIPYMEANSLLVDFEEKESKAPGYFLSACYNQAPEQVIIFDLDRYNTERIGYRLRRGKVLVNNGKVGFFFGQESDAILISNGRANQWLGAYSTDLLINNGWSVGDFGKESSGVVINNGENHGGSCEKSSGIAVNNGIDPTIFGEMATGTVIATQAPKNYGKLSKAERVLKPSDCEKIPELKKYLDELRDLTKAIKDEDSGKIFLERYGNRPRERIEMDIGEILGRN